MERTKDRIEIQISQGESFIKVTNILQMDMQRSIGSVVGSSSFTIPYNPTIKWSTLSTLHAKVILVSEDQSIHAVPIMTGYVMGVTVRIDNSSPTVTLKISDKTIDLVQCYPITEPKQLPITTQAVPFRGGTYGNVSLDKLTPSVFPIKSTLINIITALCSPFNITVIDYTDSPFVFNVATEISETETVFSTIAKLCNACGVVPHTNANGNLIVSNLVSEYREPVQMGAQPSDQDRYIYEEFYEQGVVQGNPVANRNAITHDNVLSFTHNADFQARFSDHKVIYASVGDAGEPWTAGDSSVPQVVSWAKDSAVNRWRPMVARPDSNYLGDTARYATWAKQVSRGKSNSVEVDVRYWSDVISGALNIFELGNYADIDLPKWGYKGEMIVEGVSYSISGASHRKLRVSLAPPSKYAPIPLGGIYYEPSDYYENSRNARVDAVVRWSGGNLQESQDNYEARRNMAREGEHDEY